MEARNVVVTGGASGIGAAVVEKFVRSGDLVTIVDRKPGTSPQPVVSCDLSDPDSIDEAVHQLPDRIDVLVNCAGLSIAFDRTAIMAVNFYGARRLTSALLPRIRTGGCVVSFGSTANWYWRDNLDEVRQVIEASTPEQIGDVVARVAPDSIIAYNRSKEAVLVWSAMAAQENLGRVRFNTVSPGCTETQLLTEFFEVMGHDDLDQYAARAGGRNGQPDEVAEVVAFLASHEARWVNGIDIPVDHGAEMAEYLAAQGLIPPVKVGP